MKIGDLAAATGISVEAIRYYESVGILKTPERTQGRQRIYSAIDLAKLQFVRRAREWGFSLTDVQALLALSADELVSCDDVKAIAQRRLSEVRALISKLTTVEAGLAAAVGNCSGGLVANCAVIDAIDVSCTKARPEPPGGDQGGLERGC